MPQVLAPKAVGIDISDASIKWIVLEGSRRGVLTLSDWGEVELPEGIIDSGVVHDVPGLAAALKQLKQRIPHVRAAHAALPEEAAFIYNVSITPGSSRKQILNLIEFDLDTRVPIPPSQAVYDFTKIPGETDSKAEVGVVVFPRELAKSYAAAFAAADIELLSLEVEARSVARAVVPERAEEPVVLIVDFGGTRTGLAVVKRGIPIFSSTVDIGGDAITQALIEKGALKPEEVTQWKNDRGLNPTQTDASSRAALEAISGVTSALGDEVAKHYRYWDTRRDESGARVSPISRVLLVGGSANLNGLPEYISSRVQAPAERSNVWQAVSSFDDFVPPIDVHVALQYATAIGLALRSF